jgi:1,4-dihydroxy-2-naphthoate octaprenyltransferase
VGVWLTLHIGWPILVFAVLGGAAAIFYEAPPVRWVYRGLGEIMIGLAYGPWMVLGSLYLHTRALSWPAFFASLVPGLIITALAVVNAIPDFHQDTLVGKRNLVVRLGRRRGVTLYLGLAAAGLLVVPLGVAAGAFPAPCLAALLAVPLLWASGKSALHAYEKPRLFLPAVRNVVACYMVAVGLFIAGALVHRLYA